MTLWEDEATRRLFEPLAGRKFTEAEVTELVASIQVTAEIIRSNPSLRKALGIESSVDQPRGKAYAAKGSNGGSMAVTTKHGPVGDIAYTIQVFKEGKFFVAHARELDVSSQGESVEAVKAHLREAVEVFLEEAQRMGTLTDVLEEAGYERTPEGWKAPDLLAQERAKATLSR